MTQYINTYNYFNIHMVRIVGMLKAPKHIRYYYDINVPL